MDIIAIYTNSTEETISKFIKYFTALSCKENVVYAKIRNNADYLVDRFLYPLDYPLCIYTTDGIVFCLTNVEIGPPTSASFGMLQILNYLDLNVNENDIITTRKNNVKLDIVKEGIVLGDYLKEYFSLDDL